MPEAGAASRHDRILKVYGHENTFSDSSILHNLTSSNAKKRVRLEKYLLLLLLLLLLIIIIIIIIIIRSSSSSSSSSIVIIIY